MYNFFAYIARMKYITRWSLMRNSLPENIQEHSHMVAVLAHALGVIRRDVFHRPCNPDACAAAALFHDAPEIFTGDLPTPVKYHNDALRTAYKAVEAEAAGRLLEKLPEELTEDFAPWFQIPPDYAPIIKAADKLSALIKCQEEKNSGNREFDRAMETTLASLREMALPEADAFLEEFFPAYSLTLDDQAL